MVRSLVALVLLATQLAFAQSSGTEKDRLLAVGKLWITVKYFHPYVAYRDIDWDKALVDALPKIRSAKTQADYASAIQSMLDTLHDPATRVLDHPQAAVPEVTPPADAPPQRIRIHSGLEGTVATGYYSAFQIRPGKTGVETITVPMGEAVEAVVRLSEPIPSNGAGAAPTPQPDRAYADMRYPPVEYRVLAAYKIWGVFRYFFAYREFMDEDWDDVFAASLPAFIAAKDAREYNLTVSEMIKHVCDSHAWIESEELSDYFGKAPVGLRLRLIERKPVITEILDEEAAKAGVQVGDIVLKVDGESITDRAHREERYIAASTDQWLGYSLMQRILNGPEGSMAALTISGGNGNTKEVTLQRSTSYVAALRNQRTGDVVKLLPGNIGYSDLDRLTPEQVDGMFDKFRDAKAIIFDMRGYPHGTAWSIAPRLTEQQDVAAAIFTGPLALTPDLPKGEYLTYSASYFFVQRLPATDKWKYKGKTVMLIDERTMSQAEHTGLFFEAANKTEFIGTPSAGANGDVSNFVIPGGITVHFSGHDVRHANGGQLQRVGLQPSIRVEPTISGIRHGCDEVLEKAIEYLSQ